MASAVKQNKDTAQAYGVLYAPTSVSTVKPVEELLTPDIAFVRIQWVDLTNTVRYRVLPAAYFRELLSNNASRPGIALAKVALGLVRLTLAPGFSAVGEDLYIPDLASWRVATYAPGHATVMGWFQEKVPTPTRGLAMPLCPRTILQRLVQEARDKAGVSFLVGVESEFILLQQTSPAIYVNHADWSCSAKTRTGSIEAGVLEEMAQCLLSAGIELQMYHAEAAPGQYEIVTGPLSPLEAADALIFTRETIYNIANKHGLKATFSPRLHDDSCGNGAHTHISVHGGNNSRNSDAGAARAPTLTATERSFLQGVLTHLPAACALTLPTAASYARMADGIWSGGTYACWGSDNREAPVRLTGAPGHHHFEIKCVDATATPHLAIAGLLAGGLRGILDGAELATGDCRKPAAEMSEAERREVGLEKPVRLPKTIADARGMLRKDEVMENMLGEEFVEKYLGVNETLEKYMTGGTEEETVQRLVEFY